jgi:hypothetical protein
MKLLKPTTWAAIVTLAMGISGALAVPAHAGVISFQNTTLATYNATKTDGAAWDLTLDDTDNVAFGFYSYVSGNKSDDSTVIESVSGTHMLRTGNWGDTAVLGRVDGGTFGLDSFDSRYHANSAWDDTVTGYRDGTLVATQTISGDQNMATYTFDSSFQNVDLVKIDVKGGVNDGYNSMTNFVVSNAASVPEPGSLALLGLAGVALLASKRRRPAPVRI